MALDPYIQAVKEGESLVVEGKNHTIRSYLIAEACKAKNQPCLVITDLAHSQLLVDAISYFSGRPCLELPAWETLPSENIPPSPDIVGERVRALYQFQKEKNPILLTSLQGACQHVLPFDVLELLLIRIQQGQKLKLEQFVSQLIDAGYQRRMTVTDKGEFAKRGSLVDLFALSYPKPLRIEFFDDEIETIRFFDPMGQQSVEKVSEATILPADELSLLKLDAKPLLSIFPSPPLLVLDELQRLEDRWVELKSLQGKQNRSLQRIDSFFEDIQGLQALLFSNERIDRLGEVVQRPQKDSTDRNPVIPLQVRFAEYDWKVSRWSPPLFSIKEAVENTGGDVFNLFDHEKLKLEDLLLTYVDGKGKLSWHKELEKRGMEDAAVKMQQAPLVEGFVSYADPCFGYLPIGELKAAHSVPRKQMRATVHSEPADVWMLQPGDLVVHFQHGIGKFIGMETKPNHAGIPTEFFIIEYAEKGRLYVPLAQSYLITKYVGSEDKQPVLHTLGSSRWKRTREQTLQAIQKYAKELLTLHAKRELAEGLSCEPDSDDMTLFEEEFPYRETDDQMEAIHLSKADLMRPKPMDRLICGDVGFGKTEVAMRAAFKAVVDGKCQVAVLVPTTLLALQHYETFKERMADFPVRVELLSRFRKPKERKAALEGIADGSVDIIIGTHRIVGKDVSFANLGLVIVDEEHRFGVKIKEKLKSLKIGVDFLALSATPIPRTLYLSLMGAREISLIHTPPQDRLPIKTIVSESDDELIKQAVHRELLRDGQVYFIHNRVDSIYSTAKKIEELVPHARVVVVHGQMTADEIEKAFHLFKQGERNVLVATTIVESGVDIPNANTLIIDRADRFGLADLYQLRGRVGRWNRRAFAYFLTPKRRVITEDARRRLDALVESGGFGGGMKVAMRDLEIRGAGDILGIEQTGHVSQVGFHLYCKMLKRTVQALQGKEFKHFVDTKVELPLDARIPEWYIDEAPLRMEMYQRMGEAVTFKELDKIFAELQDRYGRFPQEVTHLELISRLRIHAGVRGITLLKVDQLGLTVEYTAHKKAKRDLLRIRMTEDLKLLEERIVAAIEPYGKG